MKSMIMEYRTKDGVYDTIGIVSFEMSDDINGIKIIYKDLYGLRVELRLSDITILRIERI